ncbi:MBL fold metallo-hydrolase [Planctomicrobium piriforme]|uniref:Phosphoribosyl 1,2-cyclic phosphate phosphodiesterase n=1 Tax=Planctomicrobium piriforme TaxID=1576369 RepID=A0A1I3E650_9PLAN|nr:MBL fold metallo-hydrolase [Planctomicrobium piriforme]SFH94358.1 phosphoribosyl 1,2-cyclic phosphate phosphodiesterase [Planctomicrobium piriforme]
MTENFGLPSDEEAPLTRSLTLMGTGTSVGVPMIACDCAVCTSSDPRDQRTRTGVAIRNGDRRFLIDAGPELRLQLVKARIKQIEGVLFTHAHADHIMGLDDLRIFGFRQPDPIPLYCERVVEVGIRRTFSYAFSDDDSLHSRPRLVFRTIDESPFELAGLTVQPIRLLHGRLDVLGFRIGDVAFCTDASAIPDRSWPLLENLRVLILGAIRDEPHPTHFNIPQALEVIERCRPRQTYLTHISHSLPYTDTNSRLPDGVDLAYDGLTIPLDELSVE